MPQPESLSIEERKAMVEFQMRMKNALPPTLAQDHTVLYRFLKARNYDVDKAEKMIRRHIAWRKTHQIDNILEDFATKELFIKYFQPNILGYDKEGDIIVYTPAGKLDAKDIIKGIKMNDFMMHIAWYGEKVLAELKKHNEKTGRDAQKFIIIFDLDELTLSNATSKAALEIILRLTNMTQDNFPERLKYAILLNAPSYYMFIFSVVKQVMSKEMQKKVRPFGRSGWKEFLLEITDEDTLPAFLGGSLTDPDGNPRCNTFIRHGGKTPPSYYLSKDERYFEARDKTQKAVIPPMGKKEICIEVTNTGSRIQWKFLVKGKDIGFGLSFQISEQNVKELIPIDRFTTDDGTEGGSYKCQSAGKYVATFDNSYSWLTSKEVEYYLIVLND